MFTTKRISALLLALAMTASVTACGGDAQTGSDTTAPTGDTTPVDQGDAIANERIATPDNLPEMDMKGYNFRVLYCSYGKGNSVDPYAPEASTGDIIDDAIYDRNMRIEERFNVKISSIDDSSTDWSAYTNAIKTNILAGDDVFDIALTHIIGGPNLSLEGAFMDLYDLEHIDFTQPWWSQQMVEEMTVRGQMYVTGDVMGLGLLKSAKVHYLNLDLFDEYNVELPYEQVFDGTWTLDKMINLTKDIYHDVNGNTEQDDADIYGYATTLAHNGFLTSCNTPVLAEDKDKTLVITANTEKTANLISKLYSWYFESEGTLRLTGTDPVTGSTDIPYCARMFSEGHALTAFSQVQYATTTFRESEVTYGIIPFPKYDLNQEDYITFAGGSLMAVPVTCKDPEKVGILIEAIAAETWKTVVPAYFSIALKEKFTFDSESGKSLDIVNDSLTISFAYAYDNWKGFGHMCGSIFNVANPSPDFASYYAGRISSAEARLKLITDFYEANEK